MEKKFFIGSLELIFNTDIKIKLQEYDSLFEEKILPTTKKVFVTVRCSSYEIPTNSCRYRNENTNVFVDKNYEYRSYNSKHACDIISVFDKNNNITIYIQSITSFVLNKFRPWFHIHLEELLLANQALLLHSASIEYKGHGILFSAPSGTGKTTQTDLWRKYKKLITDINGDRTVLQLYNMTWYACGFPIYGSTVRCHQKAVPIKVIVVLKQGSENKIRTLSKREKITSLYKEITIPTYNRELINNCMDLLEKLVESIDIIELSCTIDEEAVDVLHRYLYPSEEYGII